MSVPRVPHLESPAQIRMMRQFGDVVGMTGYPEVALAREAALCYASLCIVTNPAAGMAGGSDLAISEITDLMRKNQEIVAEIIYLAAQEISGSEVMQLPGCPGKCGALVQPGLIKSMIVMRITLY